MEPSRAALEGGFVSETVRVKYHAFIGNRLLVTYIREFDAVRDEAWDRKIIGRSRAYFCRECGDIWARIVADGYSFSWPIIRRCSRHWTHLEPQAGQLVEYANLNDWDWYPLEVWLHDAQLIAQREELWGIIR